MSINKSKKPGNHKPEVASYGFGYRLRAARLKISIKFYAFFVFMLLAFLAQAQETRSPLLPANDSLKSIPLKADTLAADNRMDVVDVLKWVFRKWPHLFDHKKKRPNGPFFIIFPAPEYALATGFAGGVTASLSFYANRNERKNVSTFYTELWYTQYNQTIALFLTNFFLGHDKYELIGDWRYDNFPTYTFGLGSLTTLADADRIDYSYVRIYETALRQIIPNLKAGIGYQWDYHWNIIDFDAQKGSSTDFVKYGYTHNSSSSGPAISLLFDNRDNPNNPRHGNYFNIQFRQNLTALGSNSNWSSLLIDYRYYIPAPSKRFISTIAIWAYVWLTPMGNPPYLDMPITGGDYWNDLGRGYVLGRFRGQDMIYAEVEYRFPILKNGLLGGVVFSNWESLSEWPSNYFARFQPAIGAGLRVKFNKRTNTNGCVDYAFGTGGSRGFNFNLNEVY